MVSGSLIKTKIGEVLIPEIIYSPDVEKFEKFQTTEFRDTLRNINAAVRSFKKFYDALGKKDILRTKKNFREAMNFTQKARKELISAEKWRDAIIREANKLEERLATGYVGKIREVAVEGKKVIAVGRQIKTAMGIILDGINEALTKFSMLKPFVDKGVLDLKNRNVVLLINTISSRLVKLQKQMGELNADLVKLKYGLRKVKVKAKPVRVTSGHWKCVKCGKIFTPKELEKYKRCPKCGNDAFIEVR